MHSCKSYTLLGCFHSDMTQQTPQDNLVPDGGERNYSEHSPFVQLLKNRGRVKMLDSLLRRPAKDFNAEELSNLANISESTISRNKGPLLDLGIVNTFDRGGTTYYSLNRDNDVVELLAEFHIELIAHYENILTHTEALDDELWSWAHWMVDEYSDEEKANQSSTDSQTTEEHERMIQEALEV